MTRVLFHMQHLLGIGHHRRAERIGRALAAAGAEVVVAAGGAAVAGEDWGGCTVERLPAAHADGVDFKTLLDAAGRPIDADWQARRRQHLLDLAARVAPDVVLLESFPFARRQLRFELIPLLEAAAARRPRPLIATSLRDILVQKTEPKRVAEVVATVTRFVDCVLVHGDPQFVALNQSFPAAADLEDRVVYTGYVAPPMVHAGQANRRGVLVSAGGGAVGGALFHAALDARSLGTAGDQPWRIVCGPQLPAHERASVHTRAAALGVEVDDHRADLPRLMAAAALSISQAGYNTVLELLAAGPRAIVAPFAAASETEQTLRAELLAARGHLAIVREDDLSGPSLAAAITTALDQPLPAPIALNVDGAAEAARILLRRARA